MRLACIMKVPLYRAHREPITNGAAEPFGQYIYEKVVPGHSHGCQDALETAQKKADA